MVNEGGSMVAKIDAEIAKLTELRAFALRFDKEMAAEEVAEKPAPRVTMGVKKKSAPKPTGDDAVKDAILVFLGEQSEPSKAEDIAEVTPGVKGPQLTALLKELAEEKRVKRTGISRGTRWQIVK